MWFYGKKRFFKTTPLVTPLITTLYQGIYSFDKEIATLEVNSKRSNINFRFSIGKDKN